MNGGCLPLCAIFMLATTGSAGASDDPSTKMSLPKQGYLRVDTGLSFLGYNDVSIPDDSTSDRFSLRSLLGSGPELFGRLSYESPLGDGARGLRFVVSLLSETGDGMLANPARVGGQTLQSGVKTAAFYRFNGYRATFWWRLLQDNSNLLRIGATLNIRDAVIDVRQPGVRAYDANVGPVPLLYFQIDHSITDRWKATFETDAFAVPGGRAIDTNLRLGYALNSRADLSLGLRAFDGLGDEPGTVYNSIRYYYATIGFGFKF